MSSEPTAILARRAPVPLVSPPDREVVGRLPLPVSTLVGREHEVAAVAAVLLDPAARLVTLTGPGGVGKTRVALRVATEIEDDFGDGAAFVELASLRDPEFVLPAIAQALGLRPRGDQPAEAALRAFLHDRELLLLLDNFEHVVAAGPHVTGLLRACSRLTVLVTSRTLLHVSGERAVPVPPLSLAPPVSPARMLFGSEAVRLFVERTREVRPDFTLTEANAADVAEICRRLDGLPLAIELAAARGRLFTPAALLARLEPRLPQLTHGPRDLPARLQTMRDAIAWSYDVLSPEEQAVFRCLAVFSGGWSLEAAEAVCDHGHDYDIVAVIESLTAQSLLRVDPALTGDGAPRLTMLETIKEFAAEQLAASGDEAPWRRHAEYFLGLTTGAARVLWTDDHARWSALIEPERANLRAALDWALRHGEADTALYLAHGMGAPYWVSDAHVRENAAFLERALGLPGGAPAARVTALASAAWVAPALFDSAEARALGEEALAMARQAEDEFGVADAAATLGVVRLHAGDEAGARDVISEALTGFRRLRVPGRIAWTLCALAALDSRAAVDEGGDPAALARARACYDEALALFRAIGHPRGIAHSLHGLGYVTYKQRDLSRALASIQEVLALSWEQRWPVFAYLEDTADIAGRSGQAEAAGRLYGAADAQRERFDLPIEPPYRAEYERDVAVAQNALGGAAFAAAFAAGRALTPEQAVTEALAFTLDTPASAAPGFHLPPRSAEILPLLAAGMSNGEIAAALYLSVRTVDRHVARLFTILGVHSRAAAVAAAVAAGLLTASVRSEPAKPTSTTQA